jgi:DNA-binding beta-propeller fold protein YncE
MTLLRGVRAAILLLLLLLSVAALGPARADAVTYDKEFGAKIIVMGYGIATMSDGRVFVADGQGGRVNRFKPDGSLDKPASAPDSAGQFGSKGTGNGQGSPYDVAINESTNEVYVADASNNRVMVFTPAGAYRRAFGAGGTLDFPMGVALDAAGNVWVADCNHKRVVKFSASGAILATITQGLVCPTDVALDPAGDVYVADGDARTVRKFSAGGTPLWSIPAASADLGVAISPAGGVWVAEAANTKIRSFTAEGAYLGEVKSLGSAGGFRQPRSIAFSAATGRMYVADGGLENSTTARVVSFGISSPETSIVDGPPDMVAGTSASLSFTSATSTASFQCRLDAEAWAACASPLTRTGLTDGEHVLTVRATTVDGPDPTPESKTFTIDATAPETTITAGPDGLTPERSPAFEFEGQDAHLDHFECQTDDAAWTPCASGVRPFDALIDGRYVFAVRAVDLAGNADPSPAISSFEVLGAPESTRAPEIAGVAEVGRSLTADPGTWSGHVDAIALQWLRCNSAGGGCERISGATEVQYVLAPEDEGHAIRVRATASNATSAQEALSAATTAITVVAPEPSPDEDPTVPVPGDEAAAPGTPSPASPAPAEAPATQEPTAPQATFVSLRKGKGRSITARFRLPAGGRIRVTRSASVSAGSAQVTHAGVVSLRLELRAAARRTLARKGSLVVRFRVTHTSPDGAVRTLVVSTKLKRAKAR